MRIQIHGFDDPKIEGEKTYFQFAYPLASIKEVQATGGEHPAIQNFLSKFLFSLYSVGLFALLDPHLDPHYQLRIRADPDPHNEPNKKFSVQTTQKCCKLKLKYLAKIVIFCERLI
jgi:hypothetical protein